VGGAMYINLGNKSKFIVCGNKTHPTIFIDCTTPFENNDLGYGGGIYLYLKDSSINYSIKGNILFEKSCNSAHGKYIYIESKDLKIDINVMSFDYEFSLTDGSELKGYDRTKKVEEELKLYLCEVTFDDTKGESEKFNCKEGCIEFNNKECVINCTYPNVVRLSDIRFCDIGCWERNVAGGCGENCVLDITGECSDSCSNNYDY
jgi:hypothetical protein